MKKGHFITIEGGEGAGKSTIVKRLAQHLACKHTDVVTTREPGGIRIAEQIRSLILDKSNVEMDGRTEALLYAAARRQHLVEKIIPALEAGAAVICDRFIDSSLAYQGFARGLGWEEVMEINAFAVNGWMPDLTIYMDISPQVGLARIQADREHELNRLDMETVHFHETVREGYHKLLTFFPDRIVRVDAGRAADDVFAEAAALMDARMKA